MSLHSDLSVLLQIISCVLPSSRSPRQRGHVAREPLGDASSCSVVSWIHTLCIYYHLFWQCKLYTMILLFCSVHEIFIPCLSVLGDHPPLWLLLKFPPSLFLPLQILFFFSQQVFPHLCHLRTDDVVHFTVCKVHWGNVIVILGSIKNVFDSI